MEYLIKQIPVLSTILFLILTFSNNSRAQSVWADDTEKGSSFGLEFMIPSIDGSLDAKAPTSVSVLYGNYLIKALISLRINLPVSHISSGDLSETDIGNPYLGVKMHDVTSGLDIDIGIRLPLAPGEENAGLSTGLLLENYNLGVYIPETFSITTNMKYYWKSEGGLILNVGGGPDFVLPRRDADNEFLFNYFGKVMYGNDELQIGAALTGLLIITEETLSFGDRTIHDLGILGSYNFGTLSTGAYLRVPLDDDLNDTLNFVSGLNIQFHL